jgi:hypothetical protein
LHRDDNMAAAEVLLSRLFNSLAFYLKFGMHINLKSTSYSLAVALSLCAFLAMTILSGCDLNREIPQHAAGSMASLELDCQGTRCCRPVVGQATRVQVWACPVVSSTSAAGLARTRI